jgi:HTH-type transcriptional regulator/antitoxin HigA
MHSLIRTEEDYKSAMERLEMIFDAQKNTPAGDELELLSVLIEHYEKQRFTIDSPDPIAAIQFRMEQLNMRPTDLAEIIGYKSRVSEILSKKRKLSLTMIRKLHNSLHIPMEILVQEY